MLQERATEAVGTRVATLKQMASEGQLGQVSELRQAESLLARMQVSIGCVPCR